MFSIEWKTKAARQLRKFPVREQKRIVKAIGTLTTPKEAVNVKPLKNHAFGFRMRVGNYRVLFDIHQIVRIVSIEEVKKRDEQTY